MARSSKVAEAKIAEQSNTQLNIDIKIPKRALESPIPRVNNPRTPSLEQIADGIREIGFTSPLPGPDAVTKFDPAGGGERQ
jgi:hypothetical protein